MPAFRDTFIFISNSVHTPSERLLRRFRMFVRLFERTRQTVKVFETSYSRLLQTFVDIFQFILNQIKISDNLYGNLHELLHVYLKLTH
jgi:hypothetical protein